MAFLCKGSPQLDKGKAASRGRAGLRRRFLSLPGGGKRKEREKVEKVRTGIVGCGGIAATHVENMLTMEDVEISALAAGNLARRQALGQRVPAARQYGDWREMLEQEELDALLVCVTPDRHEGIEQAAAARGIHLYVEKPLELDIERAEAIGRAVEKAGVLCSVGYQERYCPALSQVKEALAQGRLGALGHVYGRWIGGLPASAWWRRKASSGGQVVEQCTHIFDALRFLLGEASAVRCRPVGDPFPPETADVERASCAEVAFASGLSAVILTGCYLGPQGLPDVGFTLHGEKGRVEYRWGQEALFLTRESRQTVPAPHTHRQALEAFFRAVRENNPAYIRSPYRDALRSFRLTLAANESMAAGGGWISLPADASAGA